jgi:AcrR family transcriptional regulator
VGRIAGVSAEETKERLIDAAARVFELKGFEGATVTEIAREAGLSSGAIYAHYATKAELLADALRRHADRATAALFPRGARIDAATVLIVLGSELARRDRAATALLAEALLAARRDAELAQVLAHALADRQALMAGVVARGQANGVLSGEISSEVVARFALMLGLGSMLVSELDLPAVDQSQWNAFVRRVVGAITEENLT